jgi:hypothetical protein
LRGVFSGEEIAITHRFCSQEQNRCYVAKPVMWPTELSPLYWAPREDYFRAWLYPRPLQGSISGGHAPTCCQAGIYAGPCRFRDC